MAHIKFTRDEKIWVGEIIARCAHDTKMLVEFMGDPNGFLASRYKAAFEGTADYEEGKFDNAAIVPHVNSDNVMNISIPYKGYMPLNVPPPPVYIYDKHPDGYNKDEPGTYIDPGVDPDRAYFFRVGDYVFAQCG